MCSFTVLSCQLNTTYFGQQLFLWNLYYILSEKYELIEKYYFIGRRESRACHVHQIKINLIIIFYEALQTKAFR